MSISETSQQLFVTNQLLHQILDKLASEAGAASSVEIKTSTRGVDVTVKAYVGSPVSEAGDAAVAEYFRVAQEIEARLMGRAA